MEFPPQFWVLTSACATAFVILWWWTLGRRRAQRLRALRTLLAKSEIDDADSALAALPPALSEADMADGSKPWLMFIGDGAANVPGLLAIEAQPWMFWQALARPAMAAIALSPAAVSNGVVGQRARGLWLRALMALAEQRPALPLNGIVVCVEARALLQSPPSIEPLAGRLRRVLGELTGLLELQLPVYLVVTGLERLAGHGAVCGALDPSLLAQALGHRLSPPGGAGDAADDSADALFAALADRLRALGANLLREQTEPAARLASHQWIEQLLAMQPMLRGLAAQLFEPASNSFYWRGLYFTAAASPGGEGAFTHDLLERFLPADQPLARARHAT
jgi:type VI secretion system protein ImpL